MKYPLKIKFKNKKKYVDSVLAIPVITESVVNIVKSKTLQ